MNLDTALALKLDELRKQPITPGILARYERVIRRVVREHDSDTVEVVADTDLAASG